MQVVGGNRLKDTKKKSVRGRKNVGRDDKKGEGQFDKPLHWVNMQILDHRYSATLYRTGCSRDDPLPSSPSHCVGVLCEEGVVMTTFFFT